MEYNFPNLLFIIVGYPFLVGLVLFLLSKIPVDSTTKRERNEDTLAK